MAFPEKSRDFTVQASIGRVIEVRFRTPLTVADASQAMLQIAQTVPPQNAGKKRLMCADIRHGPQEYAQDVLDYFTAALKRDNTFIERAVWLANPGTEGLAVLNIAAAVSNDANRTRRLVSSDVWRLLEFMEGIATPEELARMKTFLAQNPATL